MQVTISIPDLSQCEMHSATFTLLRAFKGGGPRDPFCYALVANFIRLTDTAIFDYQNGRHLFYAYYEHHEGALFGAALMSSGYFEACITNLHRAIRYFNALRAEQRVPQSIKDLLLTDAKRIIHNAEKSTRCVRDAIHHLDDDIIKGGWREGHYIGLIPTGDTNEDVKIINRLEISRYQVKFSSLATWLRILHNYAGDLARYEER